MRLRSRRHSSYTPCKNIFGVLPSRFGWLSCPAMTSMSTCSLKSSLARSILVLEDARILEDCSVRARVWITLSTGRGVPYTGKRCSNEENIAVT